MRPNATSRTTVGEQRGEPLPLAELLAGHTSNWGELLTVLSENRGLTVIVADPLSGASALLAAAIDEQRSAALSIDARRCADALDLGMAIADEAVTQFAPGARDWWISRAARTNIDGLRLARRFADLGIDIDELRLGGGSGVERVGDAIAFAARLVEGPVTLAIDHLGRLLSAMRVEPARELLSELRTARQRWSELDLVLVDHPDGPIDGAIADPGHPLFRAGERLRIERPHPDQFVADLVVLRPTTDVPIGLLRGAAELAGGAPALTWATVHLAPRERGNTQALAGWQALRRANETAVRREWDLLRRVHPAAQTIVATITLGLRPHSAALASKTIDDALNRLRDVGMAWQPEARRWAIADQLIAAYARDHAPPWALRKSSWKT